jgi:hypothetical protein
VNTAVTCTEDAGLEVDSLFVSAAFNRFQARVQGKALITFAATPPGRPPAALTLAGSDALWTSPITGAFGGVASDGAVPAAAVFDLAQAATAWLREHRAPARLRLAPDSFPDPAAPALENALFRLGWTLDTVDLNYHLPVTAPQAFRAGLGEAKQRQIRKLERSGAAARRLTPPQFERAYQVMADNHAARGYPMTMTWPQMQALAEALPDRVRLYGVERDGALMAASICLTLTPAYRYMFNWGEHPDVRAESPIALLAEGLMAGCAEDGIEILDLGIATDRSEPNPGLIAFKEVLRCRTTSKRAYSFRP